MATLEKIRNKAGLLVSIVGLALFSFIIGDLLNSRSSFQKMDMNNILVVDGHAVDYQEYMARENELVETQKLLMRTSNLNDMFMSHIRQVVFEDIVNEKVINPRLNELGITVTKQEMNDMVEGENISPILMQHPAFQNPETGFFDRYLLNRFLNEIKNTDSEPREYQAQLMQHKAMWMYIEKSIKRARFHEKYSALLSKALVANSLDAKEAFNNANVSSDIVYAMQSFGSISDDEISISNVELEKLYNEKKEMLRQQETFVVDYITVELAPSQDDYDREAKEVDEIRVELATTDNIAALVNEQSDHKFVNAYFSINGINNDVDMIDFLTNASIGDIEGPIFKDNQYRIMYLVDKMENADSVNVSILSPAPRATEAETRLFADSIINVIKGGVTFAEMVKKYSGDQYKENDGTIGWLTENIALQMMNEELRKTVFSLPVGQCAIVKSMYGIHIFKVTERTKNVAKYKIADIVRTVTPSTATINQLTLDLNQFIAQNDNAEKMEQSAKESGYNYVPNANIVSTDMYVGTIFNARPLVRWAANNKNGAISGIIECGNTRVVAAHKGKLPEGYQSLATATPQLRSELIAKKKAEALAAKLKAENLSSIEDFAEKMNAVPDSVKFITMNTQRIANIGAEPKLNALITFSPLNTVSEPVAGNNGVYVFNVFNRTNDEQAYRKENLIRSIESGNASFGNEVFKHLHKNAKIVDNRIRIY